MCQYFMHTYLFKDCGCVTASNQMASKEGVILDLAYHKDSGRVQCVAPSMRSPPPALAGSNLQLPPAKKCSSFRKVV